MTPTDHIVLIERMVRMEEKIDTLIKGYEKHEQIEGRVDALETHQKVISTLVALFAFALTFFQDHISNLFRT